MDSNYEIIDCYDNGWKVAFLLKDSESVCFNYQDIIQPKLIKKFRTKTTTTKGNQDILSKYDFTSTSKVLEHLELSISCPKKAGLADLMQKSLFFYASQILKMDWHSYPDQFQNIQKIFSVIFQECIQILTTETLKFVDLQETENNEDECIIWPEVFYFLNVILRDPKKSENFWERHENMINDLKLLEPRKTFLESMFFMKTKRLYRNENSMKFVYKLSKFLVSHQLVGDTRFLEVWMAQKYWEGTFKGLHNFLVKQDDFMIYKPKVIRSVFNQILDFLTRLEGNKESLNDVIQFELARFSMKALKDCKSFNRKHELVLDLDMSIASSSSSSTLCEILMNFGFFESVSAHREFIVSSKTFISYFLSSKKENDSNFLEIFEDLPLESKKEIINIQIYSENLQVSTLNQQIRAILQNFDSSFQEIILKLYWMRLKVTGNVEEFFKDISKLAGVTFAGLEKYLGNFIVSNDEKLLKSLLFGMFTGSKTLEFLTGCFILKQLDKEYIEIFDNHHQFFSFVFENELKLELSEQKKVVFQILLEKSGFCLKKRLRSIIRFIDIDSTWAHFLCLMIEKKVINSHFKFIFESFFRVHQNFENYQNTYISAYLKTIKQLNIDEDSRILLVWVNVLFLAEDADQDIFDELGEFVIQSILSQAQNQVSENAKLLIEIPNKSEEESKFYSFDLLSEISEVLGEKLKICKNILKFFFFMRKMIDSNLMTESLIINVLYSQLNDDTFEKIIVFLQDFPNHLNLISELYDQHNSNEYQDYLFIQNPNLKDEALENNLISILSKPLKFPRLSQYLLHTYSENPIIKNSTHFNRLCETIIRSPLNQLDETLNISSHLNEFLKVENQEDYLKILVFKAIQEPRSEIYDPLELLSNILTEKKDYNEKILNLLTDSYESLINSSNLKKIVNFILDLFNETLVEQFQGLLKSVFDYSIKNFEDDFLVPSQKLLNCYKLIKYFVKKSIKLAIFEDIFKEMKNLITNESLFYPRSTKLRGLFYKILLKLSPGETLQMIDEKILSFKEIIKNSNKEKLKKYSLCLKKDQKGLKREGMICYLNTTLLLLNDHQGFIDSLFSNYDPLRRNIDSLLYIFGKLKFSFVSPVNGEKILKKNGDLYFDESEQRDVSEFLNDFFESLSREGGEHLKKSLEIEFSSNLLCDFCKTPNLKVNKESIFMVECNENQSIGAKLANFCEYSRLERDNMYECSTCEKKQNATRITSLKHLPESFIIIIKRFTYCLSEDRTIKLKTKVGIEKEIEVHTEDQGLNKFYLKGVIVHTGDADSGHYFYVKKENSAWVYLNDEEVLTKQESSSDPSDCVPFCDNADPYILLYSKKLEETQLQLPENVKNRVLQKNSKYFKLSQVLREDFYDVIIQLLKQDLEHEKIINYLFLLSDVSQPEENFIKNSKILMETFGNIQNGDAYLEYMLNAIKTNWRYEYNQDHRSYIILEVLKTILLKSSPEGQLKCFNDLQSFVSSEVLENAYLIFDLILYLKLEILNSAVEDLLESPLIYIINNSNSRKLSISSIFLSLASSEVLLSQSLPIILENIDFFLSNLAKSNFEPFSCLLSKYSDDEINQIINNICCSSVSTKYSLLTHLLGIIVYEKKDCPFDYFDWLQNGIAKNDYPRLLKLASKCRIPPLFKDFSRNFINLLQDPESPENKSILSELDEILNDFYEGQVFLEFQGRTKGEMFRDSESGKTFEIIESLKSVLLVQDQESRKTELKLVYHD